MSDGYTKLFSSLIHSTVWQEDAFVKVVWITMLAMADRDGVVAASVPGLAKAAGVPLDACEAALAKFQQPDPYSRTPDNEGRRIAKINGGWELLNYAKYRALMDAEDQALKHAARQKRYREKKKPTITQRHSPSRVTPRAQSDDIAKAKADTKAEAGSPITETRSSCVLPVGKPAAQAARAVEVHSDPEIQQLAEAIRADPMFANLGAMRIAQNAFPAGNRRPVAWLLQALAEASRKCADGLTHEAKHRWLVGCLDRARAPTWNANTAAPPDDFDREMDRLETRMRLGKGAA